MRTVAVAFRGVEAALGADTVCTITPGQPIASVTDILQAMGRTLPRSGILFNVPTAPLLLKGQQISPVPTEEPYPKQDPIYLTPAQAQAESTYAGIQQQDSLRPSFVRALAVAPAGS